MKITNTLKFLILFLLPINLYASITNGTINSGNKTALVCHSVDCTTPTPGIINFAPTGATPVTISDVSGIDGVAWGNEIGWINFDPAGDAGLTVDANTGVVSGKAWSQVSGWINFSVTGQTVKINTNGEFEGYAWTGGPYGGWIKFDCSFSGACVKTDWRPAALRRAGGSTSEGESIAALAAAQVDVCPNIIGSQNIVPDNYALDEGGLCLLDIDYCKNLDGKQLSIPNKYVLNGSGQCILLTEDNESEFIPNRLTSSSTEFYTDFCPNLFGLQSKLPDGFAMFNGDCVPEEVDYCANILGNQYEIPKDMKISDSGECVKMSPRRNRYNKCRHGGRCWL